MVAAHLRSALTYWRRVGCIAIIIVGLPALEYLHLEVQVLEGEILFDPPHPAMSSIAVDPMGRTLYTTSTEDARVYRLPLPQIP